MRLMTLLVLTVTFLGVFANAQKETSRSIECGGNSPETRGAYLSIKLVPSSEFEHKVVLSRKSLDLKVNIVDQTIIEGLACVFGSSDLVTAKCLGGTRMSPVHFGVSHIHLTSVHDSTSSYIVGAQSAAIASLKKEKGLDLDSIFGDEEKVADESLALTLEGNYTCRWLK